MIRSIAAMLLGFASDALSELAGRVGRGPAAKPVKTEPSALRRAKAGSVLSEEAASMLAPPPLPSAKPKAGEPLEGSIEAEIARICAEAQSDPSKRDVLLAPSRVRR